ncbi:asparagine synthetase B [Adhaeribacter aerolatus]|uniref:asparagine synthase (glutamine-hydrolyzing) n=1 Tax=Adhaeribacter aerolatus TaxID=670289 RepID=A0A512ATC2_9BACT|nr:asparagine synthase (glutamine-hydrolyzing) [Adhaeribacter aerolatus]GEO02962.1 asparagine synthetase B [Adhaeribacter aerolatus]
MCGINLIIDKKGKLSEETIRQMTAATAHRGPDVTGLRVDSYGSGVIYFGHNRLKIIDPSDNANQPFFSADNRYVLLYNGELYNYRELRKALQQKGCTFRTNSDTEVILQILIREGQRGLSQLNGMFSLAFYDRQEQHLWLARDRFGIKPLYYAETPDYFLVSSEIKAIVRTNLVPKELDETQLAHYLYYKHAAKPQTFYRHIHELKEGTSLYYAKGKSNLVAFNTSKHSTVKADNPAQLVHYTERLLMDSVEKHLIADVPVGLLLSGGIDSTLLLALLHKAGHRHFPAFTIAHQTTAGTFGTQDTRFAQKAAQQYEANHTIFQIDDSLLTGTDAFVQELDQPIADGAALLTGYLSGQVKPHINAVLSGAGADELFGGYNRHWAFYKYLQNQGKSVLFKNLAKPLVPLLPTGFSHPFRKKFLLWHKLAHKLQASPRQTFLNFTAMDYRLQQLLRQTDLTAHTNGQTPLENTDWLRWCLRHDQHQYLISDVLALTDQAAMRHSLEVRTPYLENNLHLFLSGLSPEVLFRHGQKWVLKELLVQLQGKEFTQRSKEGFGMPLGLWLRNPQNSYLLTELQNPAHIIFNYIDFTGTQTLIQKHLRSRHDFSTELWALIVLAKWLGHNFG